jgi:hypothetical protein
MKRVMLLAALVLVGVLALGGCSESVTLDARTITWFETLCTGLAPVKDAGTSITGGASSDPKAQLDASVGAFNSIGDALSATASSLKGLPAPTFDQGDQIASTMVTVLTRAGPEVKESAQKLSATPPTDEATVTAAIQQAATEMTNSVSGLNAATYQLDKHTLAAIKAIPSCAAMGFGGS